MSIDAFNSLIDLQGVSKLSIDICYRLNYNESTRIAKVFLLILE